jgi:hypothetical protein
MSKDLDLKKFNAAGKSIFARLRRYAGFMFLIGVLCIYGFLVLRISTLARTEPSDDEVAAQMSTVKRLKIDQSSIDKIQQLQDQNIAVKSIFEIARDNPFQN